MKATKCTGAAPGYGNAKRSARSSASGPTCGHRCGSASPRRLTQLASRAATSRSSTPPTPSSAPVAVELLKSKKVPIYNARLDLNHDGTLDIYIHSKYLIINGVYGGFNNVKVVYTGSPNFSGNSLRQSNETGLKVQINSVYDAFYANFNTIRNGWTKRVTKPPRKNAKTADARTLSNDGSVTYRDSRLDPNGDYQVRSDDE